LDLDHLLHALHARDFGLVVALQLAAGDRAVLDRGVEHAGQLDVDAVNRRARDLVGRIETLHTLADQLPVLRVLQLDVRGWYDLRSNLGDLAIARGSAGWRMRDDAVGSGAFGGRHFPFIGGGLDQHHARGGAALAHIVLRGADAAAAAGRIVAPDPLAGDILAGRGEFGRHLRPVALQFLGAKLREAGER